MFVDRLKENDHITWEEIHPTIVLTADAVGEQLRKNDDGVITYTAHDLTHNVPSSKLSAIIDYACRRSSKSVPLGQLPMFDQTGRWSKQEENRSPGYGYGYSYRHTYQDKKPKPIQEQFIVAALIFKDAASFEQADLRLRSYAEIYYTSKNQWDTLPVMLECVPVVIEHFHSLPDKHIPFADVVLECMKKSLIYTAQRFYDILCFSVQIVDPARRFSEPVLQVFHEMTSAEIIHFTEVLNEGKLEKAKARSFNLIQ